MHWKGRDLSCETNIYVCLFCYLCFTFVSFILSWLFLAALWWPGGKALLCVIFPCVFITLPFGVSGKMCYRIVSVPDLCNHNIKPLVILQTRGPNGDKMSSLRDTHTRTRTHACTHTHTICDLLGDAVDNAVSGCALRCSAIFSIGLDEKAHHQSELTWRYRIYF